MENEQQLKEFFKDRVKQDFFILEEQEGIFISDGIKHNVRIDFLLKAKSHLTEKGYPDKYFGVEVKYITHGSHANQMCDLLSQCIVYRQSIFGNRSLPPFKVLAFTNLNVRNQYYCSVLGMQTLQDNNGSFDISPLLLSARFNVGYIDFVANYKHGNCYQIKFGLNTYFNRKGRFYGLSSFGNKLLGSYTGSKRTYNIFQ